MRSVAIVYHSRAIELYPKSWIDEFVASVKAQSFKDFDILELNYGGGKERFLNGKFESKKMGNHIEAMNYLISKAFRSGVDVVFNNNIDDINYPFRYEKQIREIKKGWQLVSANFRYFGASDKWMDMAGCGDIGFNFMRGHNVICHPLVAMHSSFWDDDLHYREDLLGYEDFDLWQRAYARGKRFFIIPEYLLHYRIHPNQITKEYDSKGNKKDSVAPGGN